MCPVQEQNSNRPGVCLKQTPATPEARLCPTRLDSPSGVHTRPSLPQALRPTPHPTCSPPCPQDLAALLSGLKDGDTVDLAGKGYGTDAGTQLHIRASNVTISNGTLLLATGQLLTITGKDVVLQLRRAQGAWGGAAIRGCKGSMEGQGLQVRRAMGGQRGVGQERTISVGRANCLASSSVHSLRHAT